MRATGNPDKKTVGVGMPATLYLHDFGSEIWSVFGAPPYHVGSSVYGMTWRDVDVRVILSDADYAAWGLGDPADSHRNGKWCALCKAFSLLGEKMTGLPIDFQIDQQTYANAKHDGPRSAIGIIALRLAK